MGVIRGVLNSLFFLRKDFAHNKSTKKTQKSTKKDKSKKTHKTQQASSKGMVVPLNK